MLQSMDGFPALVSDPWLNGRLTALHACSDLWACGAAASSAMATITLPMISAEEQQELLVQTIAGIRSALDEQGAKLIGGHTMESRSTPPLPASLGVQITLTINGSSSASPWLKSGLRAGDVLLISRPLGTGVLFAGPLAVPPKRLILMQRCKAWPAVSTRFLSSLSQFERTFTPAPTSPVSAFSASGRDAPKKTRNHTQAERSCHPGLPRCD